MENNQSLEQGGLSHEGLMVLFHRVARFMVRAHHHHGHGAEHAQEHVLVMLNSKGATSQRDLQELMHVRSASLSELLGKLERRGFIARERDEDDRRNYVITVTETGREFAGKSEDARRESAAAIFAPLDTEERRQLADLLQKLLNAWEKDMEEHGELRGGHGRCGHARFHGHGRPRPHGMDHEGHHHDHPAEYADHGHGHEDGHGRGSGRGRAHGRGRGMGNDENGQG